MKKTIVVLYAALLLCVLSAAPAVALPEDPGAYTARYSAVDLTGNPYYTAEYLADEYDTDYYYSDSYEETSGGSIPIAIAVSFVIALVVVLIMRAMMKTARPQPLAHEYIIDGSFNLTGKSDIFLYSTVSKTRREKSSDNGGKGGGSKR